MHELAVGIDQLPVDERAGLVAGGIAVEHPAHRRGHPPGHRAKPQSGIEHRMDARKRTCAGVRGTRRDERVVEVSQDKAYHLPLLS